MLAVRVTIEVFDTSQGTLDRPGEQSLIQIGRVETVIPAVLGATAESGSDLLALGKAALDRLVQESYEAAEEQLGQAIEALEGLQ